MTSVAVVVLGDVGRSPRMQYHCASLASLPNTTVSLIGFKGEKCVPAVEDNPRITKYLMGQPFAGLPRSLFLLWAPLKVVYQVLQLFFLLTFWIPRPRAYLVQNPPSIPALLVVWLAARLRGSKFIIDWHNFGFTVLYLSLKGRHKRLISFASRYEVFFAQKADGHLCVTNAMRLWLAQNWKVQATVLYDKPPPAFRRASLLEKHDLFARLASELPQAPPLADATAALGAGLSDESGILAPTLVTKVVQTHAEEDRQAASAAASPNPNPSPARPAATEAPSQEKRRLPQRFALPGAEAASLQLGPPHGAPNAADSGSENIAAATGAPHQSPTALPPPVVLPAGYEVRERSDRPAIVISSTSWTEDEDFGILLDALVAVDAAISSGDGKARALYPDFLVLVTGKGPQKAFYLEKIAALRLQRVQIRTLWLSPSDYPLLLGCADLGVCLHTSTSGLDLPMKVVDMFGAGLPVCAVDFHCLGELVKHDVNGLIFRTREELTMQMLDLFKGFNQSQGQGQSGGPGGKRKGQNAAAKASSGGALARLAEGVKQFQSERWQANWDARAKPLFMAPAPGGKSRSRTGSAESASPAGLEHDDDGVAEHKDDDDKDKGPNSTAVRRHLQRPRSRTGSGESPGSSSGSASARRRK